MATQPLEAVADAPVQTDSAANGVQQSGDLNGLYPDDPKNTAAEAVEGEAQAKPEDQQEAVEAETPIDAPTSWDKEAKAVFATLPTEAQAVIAQREAQRDKQVNDVSARAAEAQRQAQAEVAAGIAESQQYYAQQLAQFAQQYLPPEPNPAHYQDMQSYGLAREAWNQSVAQYQQVMQHAGQIRSQADQQIQQQQQQMIIQDARRVEVDLPELHDATAYQQLVETLIPVAKDLGYDDQRIAQAWPSDVLAMKKVAGFMDDAKKWRALQSKKMEAVRAARGLPKIPQPGAAGGATSQAEKSVTARLYPND